MVKVTYILRDESRLVVNAESGITVMEAAIRNNIRGIDADCGGNLICATCHVYVDSYFLSQIPDPEDDERDLLDSLAIDPKPTSRLSCQIVLSESLDGLVVRVPERQP